MPYITHNADNEGQCLGVETMVQMARDNGESDPVGNRRMSWHEFANVYGKCFVFQLGPVWYVFLPGDCSEVGTLDECRTAAYAAGCSIIF